MKVTISLLFTLLLTASVTSHGIHTREDFEALKAFVGYNVPTIKNYNYGHGYYRSGYPGSGGYGELRSFLGSRLPPNVRQLHQPVYYPQRGYQQYGQNRYPQDSYGGNRVQNPYQYGTGQNPFINRNKGVPVTHDLYNDVNVHGDGPRSVPEY